MTTITPGVYNIRNVATNKYLIPAGGYTSPGRQVQLNDFNGQQGAQKWYVTFHEEFRNTYMIQNFAAPDINLQPGIAASKRDLPAMEVNTKIMPWIIAPNTNGPGYFIVQADIQNQVVEADAATGAPVLNDVDPSHNERRQMWSFEAAS